MFPQFREENGMKVSSVPLSLANLEIQLAEILTPFGEQLPRPFPVLIDDFMNSLPDVFTQMLKDAEAIFAGDPAAKSLEEVVVAYPGFYGIAVFRIAHRFYQLKVPVFPRLLTELAHQFTGIDIHPGATIGDYFCIDHGTGVVVGETTVIGNRVKLYQGVTLGALSVVKDQASRKRHPTIEDNAVVYSNATILGGQTVIGHDSIVGGNVWLTSSVPPYSTVYHKSEIHLRNVGEGEDRS
ncbi:serine O-acetyltransferase [bacterium]|nr:serine O-acetyltransferase [bacterium]MBU1983010.1 serine O-acetyltransferase [bacterium]